MSNDKDKIISLNKSRQNKDSYALGELLPKLLSDFAKDLKPNIISFFENLDDTLFDLAEKAESNQNQTLYFESMRAVRKSREKMASVFFNCIKSSFQKFKKNEFNYFEEDANYNSDVKTISLSLIDEKELDETLAKTNLINKSEMAYHRHLFAFKKRFSLLASGTKLKTSHIPMGPYVIVNAFTNSLKQLSLDVTLKLILYKIFERTVMGRLNDIYSRSNQFLADKGIIPEIKYNVGRSSQNNATGGSIQQQATPNTAPQAQENGNLENGSNYANPNTNHMVNSTANATNEAINPQFIDQNYNLISQLFKQNHTDSSNHNNNANAIAQGTHSQATGPMVPVADIGMSTMINALSILQGEVANQNRNHQNNQSAYKSPTEIKDELIKQLHQLDSSTKDQKVKQKDEDTIDLVGMLFQFIVDDRNLPDAIQVILARLQIPYLKIALKDRNLFADKSHPARQLLDKLSVASISWTEEADQKNLYIKKLEDISKKILDMDEYSAELFNELIHDFEYFNAKRKKISDVVMKRTKEKSLGQEKINFAKESAAKLLIDKMTNKQMPIVVRDILLGEWASVLVLMHLRHGQKSEEYSEKVNFIDAVIPLSQKNTSITISHIEQVVESYYEGLKLVAFNPKEVIEKQEQFKKCLLSIHELKLSESDISLEVNLIPPEEILKLSEIRKQHEISDYIEEILEPSDENQFEDIKDEYAEIVANLETGTWLEFSRENNTSVRAKLSWISPITGKYLFVNSRGLKITDKSDLELSAGLRDQSIVVLQQVPLFDRALSAIASKLKNSEDSTDKTSEEKT